MMVSPVDGSIEGFVAMADHLGLPRKKASPEKESWPVNNWWKLGERLAKADDAGEWLEEGFATHRDWLKSQRISPREAEKAHIVFLRIYQISRQPPEGIHTLSLESLYTVRDSITPNTLDEILSDARLMNAKDFVNKWKRTHHDVVENPLPRRRKAP